MQNFYFLAVSLEKFRVFMIFDLLLPGFQGFSYRRRMLLVIHWTEHNKLIKSRNFAAETHANGM